MKRASPIRVLHNLGLATKPDFLVMAYLINENNVNLPHSVMIAA